MWVAESVIRRALVLNSRKDTAQDVELVLVGLGADKKAPQAPHQVPRIVLIEKMNIRQNLLKVRVEVLKLDIQGTESRIGRNRQQSVAMVQMVIPQA